MDTLIHSQADTLRVLVNRPIPVYTPSGKAERTDANATKIWGRKNIPARSKAICIGDRSINADTLFGWVRATFRKIHKSHGLDYVRREYGEPYDIIQSAITLIMERTKDIREVYDSWNPSEPVPCEAWIKAKRVSVYVSIMKAQSQYRFALGARLIPVRYADGIRLRPNEVAPTHSHIEIRMEMDKSKRPQRMSDLYDPPVAESPNVTDTDLWDAIRSEFGEENLAKILEGIAQSAKTSKNSNQWERKNKGNNTVPLGEIVGRVLGVKERMGYHTITQIRDRILKANAA